MLHGGIDSIKRVYIDIYYAFKNVDGFNNYLYMFIYNSNPYEFPN